MKGMLLYLGYVDASVVPISRVGARLCNVDGGAAMGRGMALDGARGAEGGCRSNREEVKLCC